MELLTLAYCTLLKAALTLDSCPKSSGNMREKTKESGVLCQWFDLMWLSLRIILRAVFTPAVIILISCSLWFVTPVDSPECYQAYACILTFDWWYLLSEAHVTLRRIFCCMAVKISQNTESCPALVPSLAWCWITHLTVFLEGCWWHVIIHYHPCDWEEW